MTWAESLERANIRARQAGRTWYVRGYQQRTRSHPGEWIYGAYPVPDPYEDGESSDLTW